jgi:hypothetical protein
MEQGQGCSDCFNIVKRWSYFNGCLNGAVAGYVIGRFAGLIFGVLVALVVNYGLYKSWHLAQGFTKDLSKKVK